MLGYCTNVHSGANFQAVIKNISVYSSEIKRLSPDQTGIGLWLSDQASREVDLSMLRDVLDECGLTAFTMNGFPYSDFHEEVVHHRVYEPSWCDERRLDYTLRLANILAQLIGEGSQAGISTLPLGWDTSTFSNKDAAAMLKRCVDQLEELEHQTGRCIHIDLETEPGCRLQRASELAEFMNQHFGDDEKSRRYVRVCHDTCHGAVMHESAEEAVSHYKNAGLSIGKVQLSSAIEVDFKTQHNPEVIDDLKSISEPRYLHQTTVWNGDNVLFFENLTEVPLDRPTGLWRIHFHAPIHLHQLGSLRTTQHDLERSIPVLKQAGATEWEVETYTWSVMPTTMQNDDLIASIAKEIAWAAKHINT